MTTRLHNIAPKAGAVRNRKRVGRGHGSGTHKTSGKGVKGQKARTGHHGIPKPGFEGGQTAMSRRIPKRGFTNSPFRKEAFGVNIGDIDARLGGEKIEVIDIAQLKEYGLVPRSADRIKVLGDGGVTKKWKVVAHGFSASAKELIEKAGGSIEVVAVTSKKVVAKEPAKAKKAPAKTKKAAAK